MGAFAYPPCLRGRLVRGWERGWALVLVLVKVRVGVGMGGEGWGWGWGRGGERGRERERGWGWEVRGLALGEGWVGVRVVGKERAGVRVRVREVGLVEVREGVREEEGTDWALGVVEGMGRAVGWVGAMVMGKEVGWVGVREGGSVGVKVREEERREGVSDLGRGWAPNWQRGTRRRRTEWVRLRVR